MTDPGGRTLAEVADDQVHRVRAMDYLPLLARMSTQFAPQGVRLWLVYPNPGDNLAAVRAHQIIVQHSPERAPEPLIERHAKAPFAAPNDLRRKNLRRPLTHFCGKLFCK